jgi:signal transduction histidine kinase
VSGVAAVIPRPLRRPGLLVRACLGLVCLPLALAAGEYLAIVWLVALAAIAATAAAMRVRGPAATFAYSIEALVWAFGVIYTGGARSPLMPYVVAPVFAAGMTALMPGAFTVSGIAALGLVVAQGIAASADLAMAESIAEFSTLAAQFLVISLVVGLLAAWVGNLRIRDHEGTQYYQAHRLLEQLYAITTRLPGALDPVAAADVLLGHVVKAAERGGMTRVSEAAVLIDAGGELLVPVAHRGTERLDWDTASVGSGPVAEAWRSKTPQLRPMGVRRAHGKREPRRSLAIPLVVAGHSIGVVALEAGQAYAIDEDTVGRAARAARSNAVRLATALMFDKVRELATVEERRRLSREIHDGVAQELAGLGYAIDDLAEQAREQGDEQLVKSLTEVRKAMSGLLTEVRMSIFELRSDVDRHGGLGAALAEYVRTVGATSSLTVHLILDESPIRLPAQTEAELLRIAQEAIANVRRHARSETMWVTCTVAPPRAELIIEDDGIGIGPGRAGGYGRSIMRERAERIPARLTIEPRPEGGTRVDVQVGPARPRSSTDRLPGPRAQRRHAGVEKLTSDHVTEVSEE